jgi:uncharacterized membrane protein
VDLTIVSQPEGWDTSLRGAGSTVSAVSTAANPEVAGQISGTFTAEVTVPEDVTEGTNEVVIEGRSESGQTTQLTLDITTEALQPGSVSMAADFPSLRGSTTSTFRFNLTLTNSTNTQLTFGLESQAPAGWTVDAKPSGEDQAATVVVDAGADAQVQVTVQAPAGAPADTYDIVVRAVSGAIVAETPLSVEITGSFAMTLDTSDGRLNARVSSGNPTALNLVLENTGTAPIEAVNLTATPPSGWTVTFDSETIAVIEPGQQATAQANITPSAEALAGDYIITFRANSDAASDEIEVRATVETSPLGYIIGIAVLIAVAIGLFFVFQRYGRR